MPGRIQGRIALITGASSGLGRAISLQFAAEGARICCVDLYERPRSKTNVTTGKADDFNNRVEGESTVEEIQREHGKDVALFVTADVTDASQVEAAVAKCQSSLSFSRTITNLETISQIECRRRSVWPT